MHLLSALLLIAILHQASGLDSVVGIFGETVEVPCNNGSAMPKEVFLTKWKYNKAEGLTGDLLVKQKDQNATVIATDAYKGRVSMAENYSLLLSAASLADQKTFTCMVVAANTLSEYPVNVVIHKAPSDLEISEKAEELEIGKPMKVGQCSARAASPAANISWYKNKKLLVEDGKGVVIHASVQVEPITGLSTTVSTLQYSAEKGDLGAQFTCGTHPAVGPEQVSPPVTFKITYPTENIALRVIHQGPLVEGDNVTLKCVADGSPAPTSFNFHVKGEVVKVENSDSYTISDVTRDATGEYKCSLVDASGMEASANVTVSYLDVTLTPSEKVSKKSAGESLAVDLQIDASEEAKVSWTKDNVKLEKQPKFNNLTFSDSGRYECEVSMGPLSQKASFELAVHGSPVITKLSKRRGEDGQHKVLICEAEGYPKPQVTWSINGTSLEESPFTNGRISHRITVVPTANLSVSCMVSNELGQVSSLINVSSLFEEVRVDKRDQSDDNDQTKLVVGVVVGLVVATVVIGVAYWVYMKKSKQGTWKTGEKENGSSEEEKKLEEKSEENSQKAEV